MNPGTTGAREILSQGTGGNAFYIGTSGAIVRAGDTITFGAPHNFKAGDAVLYGDLDYDSMQTGMAGMAKLRGLKLYTFDLPEPATRQSLIDAYEKQLTAHPDVKLMLVTHLSHRTGLVPPVKEITAMARAKGVDVLLDCGHALGQVDFKLRDLGVDFAGLNLHKWIGSPVGVGLVYIRKDRIGDIDVNLAEPPSPRIEARVHTGTVNYAAQLAVSDAIDFHNSIGLANKAYRMRFLRDRWAEAIRPHPGVEVLTPNDPDLHAGITSFRFKGQGSPEQVLAVKKALFDRYRIFTVERFGPAKGACVRVSPSFINTPADLAVLKQKVVVNCTGYGARALWKDESIVPVRGQIAWLIPRQWVTNPPAARTSRQPAALSHGERSLSQNPS